MGKNPKKCLYFFFLLKICFVIIKRNKNEKLNKQTQMRKQHFFAYYVNDNVLIRFMSDSDGVL